MSRVSIAVLGGLLGFVAYAVVVVTAADWVAPAHWAVQALYFLIAGSLWVLPARWLMLWAAHRR